MVSPIVVSDLKALRNAVLLEIKRGGPAVDLNHIDVGGVDTFDGLFKDTGFCGDVSQWNMSQAKSAVEMFAGTPFNSDVSRWDVAVLLRRNKTQGMFTDTPFSQDLTMWRIAGVRENFQAGTLAAFTRNTALWAAISGDKEKPAAFTPETLRKNTVNTYADLFGGPEGLSTYLAKVPFGVMHFDACCVTDTCPAGIAQADFDWCKDILSVGTALGLANAGIRELFGSQWPLRHDNLRESFPIVGLGYE